MNNNKKIINSNMYDLIQKTIRSKNVTGMTTIQLTKELGRPIGTFIDTMYCSNRYDLQYRRNKYNQKVWFISKSKNTVKIFKSIVRDRHADALNVISGLIKDNKDLKNAIKNIQTSLNKIK